MSSTAATETSLRATRAAHRRDRWTPLTGFAFVVFFLAGVIASSPPSDKASNARWVADYAGRGNQTGHVLTGIFLILAGLSLLAFISGLWARIARASKPAVINPLPLVAAGVAAACIAMGGVLMATVSGSIIANSGPEPGADLLRFSNDAGFAMAGIAGMLAAALSVGLVSLQARRAGVFGGRLTVLGVVASVVLVASFLFIPILALLVWLIAASITLLRAPAATTG